MFIVGLCSRILSCRLEVIQLIHKSHALLAKMSHLKDEIMRCQRQRQKEIWRLLTLIASEVKWLSLYGYIVYFITVMSYFCTVCKPYTCIFLSFTLWPSTARVKFCLSLKVVMTGTNIFFLKICHGKIRKSVDYNPTCHQECLVFLRHNVHVCLFLFVL